MTILDGKATAASVKQSLKVEIETLAERFGRAPKLAAVLLGNDGASETYVGAKVRSCKEIGIESLLIRKSENISEDELLLIVNQLNTDDAVDGILVQLPLPKHINEERITLAIAPIKDVDGFHPENLGRLVLGVESYTPATPLGIMMLLSQYKINTEGMHAVVIGRSAIVGTPMSLLLSRNSAPGNCTVTLAHSRTKNLKELTLQADLIIAALGKPEFLTADMVKNGAVVIDVGITRVEDSSSSKGYVIKGDVNFTEVSPKCSYITPVPGGVGAMTIAALMKNTVHAFIRRNTTADI
jgi:methylenetetrahydrofolate dehydrogenase (NADP+) / methenyltetrahydrofolate cyclohydrolase